MAASVVGLSLRAALNNAFLRAPDASSKLSWTEFDKVINRLLVGLNLSL